MSKLEKMTKDQLKQEIVMLNMEISALVDKLNLIEQNWKATAKAADARIEELEKENKKLKEKLALTENDRDEWEVKAKDLIKENKELKEELQHYKNTEAIQKSNDASRWKPGCMSYVDRELNHF